MNESNIAGCVLGTAVGDSIGLPYEKVSRRRLSRLLGRPDRHRFLLGRGMISDDTEHVCLIAQSLIASNFDPDRFTRDFAGRLRWWFVSISAGMGRASIRSCVKLWLGFSPKSSGVFSAGNGPAMRSAIFGAVMDDLPKMVQLVKVSTRISHTDPKAEYGAVAVALAAYWARRHPTEDSKEYLKQLEDLLEGDGKELTDLIRQAIQSVDAGGSTQEFADQMGLGQGVSGYTYHTVPVAIHAWRSHPHDMRTAITSVVECGGDADTVAAIVGGIIGSGTGESGVPGDWLSGICEWPRTVNWMRSLASQLANSASGSAPVKPIKLNFVLLLMRNLFFLFVVLIHGFRRLLPPY